MGSCLQAPTGRLKRFFTQLGIFIDLMRENGDTYQLFCGFDGFGRVSLRESCCYLASEANHGLQGAISGRSKNLAVLLVV